MAKRGIVEMMQLIIGAVLVIIVIFTVVGPIINSAAATNQSMNYQGNLTNYATAQVITQQLPTFNVLVGLAVIAGLVLVAIGKVGIGL
jgi:hypothetical protein